SSWPVLRCSADRLCGRLCAARLFLQAVGFEPDRSVRLSTRPPAALRRLFLRRRRGGSVPAGARPARIGWSVGATVGSLAWRRLGGVPAVDARNRIDDGRTGRREARHRRRSRVRAVERRGLLLLRGGIPALRRGAVAAIRRSVAEYLWHLSGALCLRNLAAIPAARRGADCRRQG